MRIETLGEGDPEVAVVGGIHGDEPAGVHAVETLLAERPPVERPVALVVANEAAGEAGERYLDADLNRSFPGSRDADAHEERLAAELAEAVGDCTTLALHTTQSYEDMFAIVDEIDDLARSACPRLSVDAVVEAGADYEGRIFASVPDAIEVECGYQGSEAAKDNAVQVAREFLRAVDALPGEAERKRDELPVFGLGGPVTKQSADVYEVYATNFEEVAAGEAFAAADGDPIEADESFHPVLMSPEGYEDVFGYTAERVGTL
ncbi:succinylglutamate desuccinylase/aspartoacylase domain-containing protein [Halomicrobium urmianum]|uniref:succinylglutamate desuccinylase/aspartoacylase domain-containing protein n=1 Tax=Halomicrobium urmianum TaxID=1586233 RepID=UPI001CD9B9D9|nr:succinylglutamate desuccinylase/aspartoacylase family protein [Halomicrobium urmianum]